MNEEEIIRMVNGAIERKWIGQVEELMNLEPARYEICQKRGIVRKLKLKFKREPRKGNKKTINEDIA